MRLGFNTRVSFSDDAGRGLREGIELFQATVVTADLPAGMRISPVFHGTPDEVTAAVLTDLAQTVAPALGWTPADV